MMAWLVGGVLGCSASRQQKRLEIAREMESV